MELELNKGANKWGLHQGHQVALGVLDPHRVHPSSKCNLSRCSLNNNNKCRCSSNSSNSLGTEVCNYSPSSHKYNSNNQINSEASSNPHRLTPGVCSLNSRVANTFPT